MRNKVWLEAPPHLTLSSAVAHHLVEASLLRQSLPLAALLLFAGCSSSTEPADPSAPASIVIAPDSLQSYPGWTIPFPATTVYNSSHDVIQSPVHWTTADSSVARADESAGIQMHKIGSTTLVATAGSISQSAKLIVAREPVSSIVIAPASATLSGLDSLKFVAWAVGPARDSLGDRSIAWSTPTAGLISISSAGVVHVLASGTAFVVATSEGVSDSVGFVVDARRVARITVVQNPLRLLPGTHSDTWIYHTYDASDNELDRHINWTSSDTTIATVDAEDAVALRTGSVTLTARVDSASIDVPLVIAPVSFSSITAGGTGNACALTSAHDAYCWGGDNFGQLGTTTYDYAGNDGPAPVLGGLKFTTISAGETLTCGLVAGGAAYCWGGQDFVGQGSPIPQLVQGVTLVSLSLSGNRACGLDAGGIAHCWGGNDYSNLFMPPAACGNDCRVTPVATGNGTQWQMLSAGDGWHICGVDDGEVARCWGVNASGQLGDGSLVDESDPVPVHGGIAFAEVSAGEATTCGLTPAGAAFCWGSDRYGSLGSGDAMPSCNPPPFDFNPCSLLPKAVAGAHRFTQVGVAHEHACALDADGAVWCWGFSVNGDGTPTTPTAVAGSVSFRSISVNDNNCGMSTDGFAYCWRRFETPVRVPGQQ